MDTQSVGLVLEGGGMRGSYTSGVLDFFLEKHIYFNYIIGVSAGACNAMSYISKQKGRNARVNIDYIKDKRYMSFTNLIKDGSFFGMDFIFNEIPKRYVPFDFETFHNSNCEFLIGTTDCNTGKSVYFNKNHVSPGLEVLKASASLPLVSPIINFKGLQLLDGGLADPIPIKKSIKDGNEKNIVVLTRNKGYRKAPTKIYKLLEMKYKNYPNLLNTIKYRYKKYNETLYYIENLEAEGKVLILRPSRPLQVDRFERNPEKLSELLQNGYEDAVENYDKILAFMGENLLNKAF